MKRLFVLLLAAACNGGGSADPDPPPPTSTGVRLVQVASGLDQPVEIAAVPGSDRLAVVEKTGRLLLLPEPGDGVAGTLLDLRGKVSTGSEQGLL
ncbi:MAG TPA: hypothetical protein VFJ82_22430, partial [Longimicrobium sp.]|nr:hypothetical protein [Longimicrobium sp.]